LRAKKVVHNFIDVLHSRDAVVGVWSILREKNAKGPFK